MNREKLHKDSVEYLQNCMLDRKYMMDSTGMAMPTDMAEFGAMWMIENIWITVDPKESIPLFVDVIGYNKEWINEFNPNGTRIGYFTTEGNSEMEFHSAVYQSDSEDYGNCREEGDDYDTCQEQPDGTTKTWYNNDGNNVEGHRPNMPTHYMLIPKHPDE